MQNISIDVLSLRCVWGGWGEEGRKGGREGETEVGILIVPLSAGEGEGKNSVKRDIMQV